MKRNKKSEQQKIKLLQESIKPIVAKTLYQAILNEKKSQKQSDKNFDELLDGIMNNKEKSQKFMNALFNNKSFAKKARVFLNDEDAYDGWVSNLDDTYDKLDNISDGSKRRAVTTKLKDEKVDCAPIAYKVWPDMSPAAARSWFSKKIDGKNAEFTDEEVAEIYNILNNSSMV